MKKVKASKQQSSRIKHGKTEDQPANEKSGTEYSEKQIMEVHQTMLQLSSQVKDRQTSEKRWPLAIKLQEESTGKGVGSTSPFSHLNSSTGGDSLIMEWKMYTMFIRLLMTNRKTHVYRRRFPIAGRHIRIMFSAVPKSFMKS